MTALAVAWVLVAASAPRLDIYRTRAVPWVGALVEYQAAVVGATPGSRWRIEIAVRAPDGQRALVARGQVAADTAGVAAVKGTKKFTEAGWHELEAWAEQEIAAGGKRLQARLRVPVTARRVDFAWYQAERGRELRWVTIQLTCGKPEEREYWRRRGVLPARWCGAACGKHKPVEFFAERWSSHDAIAIDEFGGDKKTCEKFYRALIEARKRNPHNFIAVWFCGCYDLWPKLRELIDLFLPEVYLNYTTYDLGRFDRIVALAKRAGVFDKMLVGLGINVVKNKDGSVRYRPTPVELVEEIRYLKQIAPDLRGVAFFTYGSAEPAVRAAMDWACLRYFVQPAVDLLSAEARPEQAPPGQTARVTVTLRNAGGMDADGIWVAVRGGKRTLARQRIALAAGEQKKMGLTVQPDAGVRELVVAVEPPKGVSVLRGSAAVPVARTSGAVVAYAPAVEAVNRMPLPWEALGVEAGRVRLLDASGRPLRTAPTATIQPPGQQARTVWVAPGDLGERATFWALDGPQRQGLSACPVRVQRRADGALVIESGTYAAVLAPADDAIASLKVDGVELLKSPWRVGWSDWKGFGEAQVAQTAVGVRVLVPVRNERLGGWSQYVFYPAAIEIERSFSAPRPLTVEHVAEGARIKQRAGRFARQWAGVGTRVSSGCLQVSSRYRDIYFGATCLSGKWASRGGWFDFCWDKPRAGLGVAIARMWQDRASRVNYDVTRYYDGGDFFEIAQIWHQRTEVTSGHWRIFLVPHGPVDSSSSQGWPARALWERLQRPARLLRT